MATPHSNRAHALLSASSAHRWLICPPSAKLADQIPPEPPTEASLEGTAAHELAEHKLRLALGRPSDYEPGDRIDGDMEECTDSYVDYIKDLIQPGDMVLIEHRVSYAGWAPEGFGTCDCIIIGEAGLKIIDFKYGKGVRVDAHRNPQLMLYALGTLATFDGIYDIRDVELHIYQPRLNNYSKYHLTKDMLTHWGARTVEPTAHLAYKGYGPFRVGSHCRFCPAAGTCRARANVEADIAKWEFREPAELTNQELAELLPTLDDYVQWANAVKKAALAKARADGLPGYKVVAGRGRRALSDLTEAARRLEAEGLAATETKPLSMTAMEKKAGRKKFKELVGDLIVHQDGAPALAPADDPRPEWHSAAGDFA